MALAVLSVLGSSLLAIGPAASAGSPGQLDLAFGSCGVSTIWPRDPEIGQSQTAGTFAAVAVQTDGRVVLVGEVGVTRLLTDGSLDHGFGYHGTAFWPRPGHRIIPSAVVIQADGRVLVGGTRIPYGGPASYWFARYLADGQVDAGFGTGGMVVIELGVGMYTLALQADGKILGGGAGGVARLLPTGTLDPTFGSGGVAAVPSDIRSLAVGAGGTILAGVLIDGWGDDDAALVRLLPTGSLDAAFGSGGVAVIDLTETDEMNAIGLDSSGRILSAIGRGQLFFLVRHTANGQPDATFGSGGVVAVPDLRPRTVAGMVVEGDGSAVVAIDAAAASPSRPVGLTRFAPDGSIDSDFGVGGTRVLSGLTDARGVARTPGGGWMVSGRKAPLFGGPAVAHVLSGDPATAVTLADCAGSSAVAPLAAAQFGHLAIGLESPPYSFAFRSVGTAPVRFDRVDFSNDSFGQYRLRSDGCSGRVIAPGGSCTVTVNLAPTRVGHATPVLIAWSDAEYGSSSIQLQGHGRLANPVSGWGSNGVGQVGAGPAAGSGTPATVALPPIHSVAAGQYHSLALAADGTVWAWGWNGVGQLGDGTTVDRAQPVRVPGLTGVAAIAAGAFQSFAVGRDGSVLAWGLNHVGQLGDGTTVDRHSPTRLTGLPLVRQVSSGGFHTLAVASDGRVWAWGWNAVGQLGDGTTVDRHQPVVVAGLAEVGSVAAGAYHSLATTFLGAASSWGLNHVGQLGDGTTTDRHVPGPVAGLESGATALAGGGFHSLAVKNRKVVAWGWNALGQLGDGTTTDRLTPVPVALLDPFVDTIAAGVFHSLAVTALDGYVRAWGWNDLNQLGAGWPSTIQAWPTSAPGLSGVDVVSGGVLHSLSS